MKAMDVYTKQGHNLDSGLDWILDCSSTNYRCHIAPLAVSTC